MQWANDHGDYILEEMKPFAAPLYLLNSTMETYLQTNPIVDPETGQLTNDKPSSCINCHALSTYDAGHSYNFSFLPGYAK